MAAGTIASVTVSNITDTSFRITWPAATGGDTTTGYNMFIPSGTYRSSNFTTNGDGTFSYTFATITSGGATLTPGTTYTWGVEANSASGVGPRVTGSTTTTGGAGGGGTTGGVGGTIGTPTVSEVTSTSFRLTWPAATGGGTTTGYNVFLPSGSYLSSVNAQTLTYLYTGLTAGTAYTWGVEAQASGGLGPRTTGNVTTAAAGGSGTVGDAPPTVEASTPSTRTVWNDPIVLTAAGDFTAVTWAVTVKPSGSTSSVTGTSPASFVPDKVGDYTFVATGTGPGGSSTSSVTVRVGAQLWRKTGAGTTTPVVIVRRTS